MQNAILFGSYNKLLDYKSDKKAVFGLLCIMIMKTIILIRSIKH